jgi:hypothetical protein
MSDIMRSRKDLIAENAILRQQLIVLNRQVKRPQFTSGDRLRLVLLSRLTQFWDSALHLIQPQTVLRWHRDLFRLYWKRKSRPKNRKLRIPQETIDLIKDMAEKNWLWGSEKIQGELLKLGIKVSKRTIQKYMKKVRKRSGQNWRTFLKNHDALSIRPLSSIRLMNGLPSSCEKQRPGEIGRNISSATTTTSLAQNSLLLPRPPVSRN